MSASEPSATSGTGVLDQINKEAPVKAHHQQTNRCFHAPKDNYALRTFEYQFTMIEGTRSLTTLPAIPAARPKGKRNADGRHRAQRKQSL
jgi:hypothetical protein